jgi:DNA-binding response OmpR family regulator
MTVRNVRHKLEAVTPGESYITTEYGVGYRLTAAVTPVRPVVGG